MGKRIAYAMVAATIGAFSYWALRDTDGSLDVPGSFDVVSWRIGHGLRGMVGAAKDDIKDTNEGMQNVVDGRQKLNDRRIRRDTK